MMLAEQLAIAEKRVEQLKREIAGCEHEFVDFGARFTSTGDPGICGAFVQEQGHRCGKCGLMEIRRQYRPNDTWTDWEPGWCQAADFGGRVHNF